MKLKFALAAAITVASTVVSAVVTDQIVLSPGDTSDTFAGSLTVAGSGTESLLFTLFAPLGVSDAFVGTIKKAAGDIDFTSVTLLGPGGPYSFSLNSPDPFETWSVTIPSLPLGNYTLQLGYVKTGTATISYAGSFEVTAVPEPGTYAMLLAGLAAVGFVAKRRSA